VEKLFFPLEDHCVWTRYQQKIRKPRTAFENRFILSKRGYPQHTSLCQNAKSCGQSFSLHQSVVSLNRGSKMLRVCMARFW